MTPTIAICSDVDLDVTGARTATWLGRLRAGEELQGRIARDLPLVELHRDDRAEYVAGRCLLELDWPIASDPRVAAESRRITETAAYRLAATMVLDARQARIAEALGAGGFAAYNQALELERGDVLSIQTQFVTGRWPLGALQLRGTVLRMAAAWIESVQRQTTKFCAGAVVLTWFLETGSPSEERGLDVRFAVTTIPRAHAQHPPLFPMIVHRELLDRAELRLIQHGQRPPG